MVWSDDVMEEDDSFIGRLKDRLYFAHLNHRTRKKRKKNRRKIGRNRISYVPYICDYLWIDEDGVRRESFRIYRDGRVFSLLDDTVFCVSERLINDLIKRLEKDLIPYAGGIGLDPPYGGETWYLYFYDRNGEVASSCGGCDPSEYDFEKVIEFIEEEIIFPNVETERVLLLERDEWNGSGD